jgi:hypothetical protein
MDEQEKERVRKQAQDLLEDFGKKLESVKLKQKEVKGIEGGFRIEQEGNKPNSDFRKRMFANAPEKNEDNILAEKKSW